MPFLTFNFFSFPDMSKNLLENTVYYYENGKLVNQHDGYIYETKENDFVLNDEFYPTTLILESENVDVEFYVEDCFGVDNILSYINYTNQAITTNNIDYKNVKENKKGSVNYLSWERNKLNKIKNDKNYYLKVDIPKMDKVYTILVKSTMPITDKNNIVENLSFCKTKEEKEPLQKKYNVPKEWNEETKTLYNYIKNSEDLKWGIFQPDYLEENSELNTIENGINYQFEFLLWYTGFQKEYDSTKVRGFLDKAYKDNKIVELTLQPMLVHEEGNDLFRVLNGEYDDFLDAYVKDIVDFQHPVLFRFANEMNGDWCEYSGYRMSLDTKLYREMYKYIYSFFEKYQADNVIWVWNPNGKSFPNFKWNYEEMYYPGNNYVDLLGLTLYNTGNFYDGEEWKEFGELYDNLYHNSLKKYDMPFMITEFASATAGGNKQKWIQDMLNHIEKYSNIKIAVWWNHADYSSNGEIARSYFINDNKQNINIFKEYFKTKKK